MVSATQSSLYNDQDAMIGRLAEHQFSFRCAATQVVSLKTLLVINFNSTGTVLNLGSMPEANLQIAINLCHPSHGAFDDFQSLAIPLFFY